MYDELILVLSLMKVKKIIVLEKINAKIFNKRIQRIDIEENYIIVNKFVDEIIESYIMGIRESKKTMGIDFNVIRKLSEKGNNQDEQIKIILGLTSDDDKIDAMIIFHINEDACVQIINSMISIEKRIDCLDYLENSYAQKKVIYEISELSDEQKFRVIKKLKTEVLKRDIAISIKSDEVKIKCIPLIRTMSGRKSIILTLSEENRIKQLKKVDSMLMRKEIVSSIKDENVKRKALQQFDDEETLTMILMSMQNDSEKEKNLLLLKNELNIARVISTFIFDNDKIRLLDQIMNPKK